MPLKAIASAKVQVYPVKSKKAEEFLAFIHPTESIEDVLVFEELNALAALRCLIVTKEIIGWGQPGKEKKGFFSLGWAEEKVIVPFSQVCEIFYERAGLMKSVGGQVYQKPKLDYRNKFGVRESVLIPTEQFCEQTKSLLAWDQHKNAEAFVMFLRNWVQRPS